MPSQALKVRQACPLSILGYYENPFECGVEGGCYAKAINLTSESEPDIFSALRFGAVLENVVLEDDHSVDYADASITENTRGAYPINFIRNSLIPCLAGHPTDIIFLTCVEAEETGVCWQF